MPRFVYPFQKRHLARSSWASAWARTVPSAVASDLEALSPRPVFEVYKTGDAPFCVPVPEAPFGALKLGECMGTDCSIGGGIYALGKLLEILKLHADVKPVQHMLSLRCQLAMNRSQTSIAIGKYGDQGAVVCSTPAKREARGTERCRASAAYEGKTRCNALVIEHLACNDLEIALRSRMTGSHVSTIHADNDSFAWSLPHGYSQGLRRSFKPLSDLDGPVAHRVRRYLCG